MNNNTSKFMSLILRHDPSAAGVVLDANGWCAIAALLEGMAGKGHALTRDQLNTIVSSDNKQRYSISPDGLMIRANQGHSVQVDLGLVAKVPPAVLYHGTAERFAESIKTDGIKHMSRQHVHLSASTETAIKVGSRHGKPHVFSVDTVAMLAAGFEFYESENGVWLTGFVPTKYLL
jgi:putative RNA 2'-phosphotransferase